MAKEAKQFVPMEVSLISSPEPSAQRACVNLYRLFLKGSDPHILCIVASIVKFHQGFSGVCFGVLGVDAR